MLLHFWLDARRATARPGVRALSRCCSRCWRSRSRWWAGRAIWGTQRAAWFAAVLMAFNPFLSAVRAGGADVLAGRAAGDPGDDLLPARLRARRRRDRSARGSPASRSRSRSRSTRTTGRSSSRSRPRSRGRCCGCSPTAPRAELLRDGLLGFGGAVRALPAVGADDALPGRPHRRARGRTRRRSTRCSACPACCSGGCRRSCC